MKMPAMDVGEVTGAGDEVGDDVRLASGEVVLGRIGPLSEVVVRGEVDIATTPAFEAAVATALEAGADELSVDLGEVTFLGSSGLAGLLKAQRLMREAGGRLVLREPSEAVRDLLQMTRLLERFGLEDDGA